MKKILIVLAILMVTGTLKAQEHAFKKIEEETTKTAYLGSAAVAIPSSYYFSAVAEEKARRGVPISKKENFVRKHPALISLLATLGLGRVSSKARKVGRKVKRAFTKRADFNLDRTIGKKVAQVVANMDSKSLDDLYHELVN